MQVVVASIILKVLAETAELIPVVAEVAVLNLQRTETHIQVVTVPAEPAVLEL
jgi:hypothetical protein